MEDCSKKKSCSENGTEINILGVLSPKKYFEVLSSSSYVFLSPGLTGLYEVLACKKPFCLLPGLNVSQIYQICDFKETLNFKYCIAWPEADRMVAIFNKQPELESLSYLRDYLLTTNRISEIDFKTTISNFVNDVENNNYYVNEQELYKLFKNQKVEDLVVEMIKQIENCNN